MILFFIVCTIVCAYYDATKYNKYVLVDLIKPRDWYRQIQNDGTRDRWTSAAAAPSSTMWTMMIKSNVECRCALIWMELTYFNSGLECVQELFHKCLMKIHVCSRWKIIKFPTTRRWPASKTAANGQRLWKFSKSSIPFRSIRFNFCLNAGIKDLDISFLISFLCKHTTWKKRIIVVISRAALNNRQIP